MSDYLSEFTGPEIDGAIADVPEKIDRSEIVNDLTTAGDTVPSSATNTNTLYNVFTDLDNATVKIEGAQTINGIKTFTTRQVFDLGLQVSASTSITIPSFPLINSDATNKLYVDSFALTSAAGGKGVTVVDTPTGQSNIIDLDLANNGGLKFTVNDSTGQLSIDINGTVESGTSETNDYILGLDTSSDSLYKITKSNLLGDLAGSTKFRGTWDPSTNTVTGDSLNTSLTKNVAPNVSIGDTPVGYQYFVNTDGDFDLIGDTTLESFEVGDSVVWSGATWTFLPNKDAVTSFTGAQGSTRQGPVTATVGDYNDNMVQYTRPNASKNDIQSTSTNLLSAINDLDDLKASNDFAILTGTTQFSDGFATAPSISFTNDTETGLYRDVSRGVHVISDLVDVAEFNLNNILLNRFTRANNGLEVNGNSSFNTSTNSLRIGTDIINGGYIAGRKSDNSYDIDDALKFINDQWYLGTDLNIPIGNINNPNSVVTVQWSNDNISFEGIQGTKRTGNVVAISDDYTAQMITYNRSIVNRKEIRDNIIDVYNAINDLDDYKARVDAPIFATSIQIQGGLVNTPYIGYDSTNGSYFTGLNVGLSPDISNSLKYKDGKLSTSSLNISTITDPTHAVNKQWVEALISQGQTPVVQNLTVTTTPTVMTSFNSVSKSAKYNVLIKGSINESFDLYLVHDDVTVQSSRTGVSMNSSIASELNLTFQFNGVNLEIIGSTNSGSVLVSMNLLSLL